MISNNMYVQKLNVFTMSLINTFFLHRVQIYIELFIPICYHSLYLH